MCRSWWMENVTVDVVVVGGGPAGCVAAEELGRCGLRVMVVEEHPTVGEPVDCSGVIGTEAFESLDLPRDVILGEVRELVLVSPSGLTLRYDPPKPLAYVVDRAAFDRRLAERAQAAGAEVRTGWRVTDLRVHAGGVQGVVQVDGEVATVEAKAAVLAHGPRYHLQERLGMGRPPALLRTAQVEVEVEGVERTQAWFGREVAPGSFAWIVPFRRGGGTWARVGVSATEPAAPYLEKWLRSLRRLGWVKGWMDGMRSWVIPVGPIPRTYSDRVVAVGDAAGQCKPTTGGGLLYGLVCARLAAQTLVEGFRRGDLSARVLRRYQARWQARLGREFKVGSLFRRLCEKLRDEDIDEVFRVVGSNGLLHKVTRRADFDRHSPLILTLLSHPSLARAFLRGLLR